MVRQIALAFAVIIGFGTAAQGSTLTLPVVLSEPITHAVLFSPSLVLDLVSVNQAPFTADLGLYDSIVLDVSVNDGQVLQIAPPAGASNLRFVVEIGWGPAIGSNYQNTFTVTPTFVGLNGTAPSLDLAFGVIGNDGQGLDVFTTWRVTDVFSFQGLILTLTSTEPFPSAGSTTYSPNPGSTVKSVYSSSEDLGSAIQLQAVPEPATVSLFSIGLASMVARRRRSTTVLDTTRR